MLRSSFLIILSVVTPAAMLAQGGAQGQPGAPAQATTPQAAAPIDLTGYWVSQIVDEWRFRVVPQKGDIPYLPINAEARKIANAWDPDKDIADKQQCRAYGAVGVMQRPGRLHITWENDRTLRIDTDAGTQTRLLHFGAVAAQKGERSWQGYSTARWEVAGRPLLDTGGTGFVPGLGARAPNRGGTLIVKTDNLLSGYIRKNGVPYSEDAVLTEYFNLATEAAGVPNQAFLILTAFVDDPKYLNGPFIRTYDFKKQPDATGWDPTPCLNK